MLEFLAVETVATSTDIAIDPTKRSVMGHIAIFTSTSCALWFRSTYDEKTLQLRWLHKYHCQEGGFCSTWSEREGLSLSCRYEGCTNTNQVQRNGVCKRQGAYRTPYDKSTALKVLSCRSRLQLQLFKSELCRCRNVCQWRAKQTSTNTKPKPNHFSSNDYVEVWLTRSHVYVFVLNKVTTA